MIEAADAIVEGEVISKTSFEFEGDIYTENIVQINSILKEQDDLEPTLSIVTLGGRTADRTQSYSHVAHLNVEDEGVFLVEKSNILKGAYRLIGETNGYYRESNKYKGRYYSYAGYFDDLSQLKFAISNRTQQLEKKIIQRGCFNLTIDFDANPSLNSNKIGFRILCSSDIPATYLNTLFLPLIYDLAEFSSDPFDNGSIIVNLPHELESNYTLNQQRLNENNVAYLISRDGVSNPVFIGSEFVPILEGSIDITALEVQGLPRVDILKSTLLENTNYITPDFNGPPKPWNCLEFDNNVFNEFIPRIDSIAPLNVAAGVGDMSENGIPGVITIYGSGFGTPATGAFSAGTVGFPDAESIIPSIPLATQSLTFPAELDYISWSDTEIRVRVPTRNNNTNSDADQGAATSGRITVTVNGNSTVSNQELYVHFGMFNDYQLGATGAIGAKKRRMSAQWRSINESIQGYRLLVDQSVLDSIPNAFLRIEMALDQWRCHPDHPIWIELDSTNTGLHTGIITMEQLQNSSLAALTGIVSVHQECPDISVSNTIEIKLNSNFTFVNFPVSGANNMAYFDKVIVHEFGHGFLARHTVNQTIMYKDDFFQNLITLTDDDHLCGSHTFMLGNQGPLCNPTGSQIEMDLNIGSFNCQTNSVTSKLLPSNIFDLYPNPNFGSFNIKLHDRNIQKNELSIKVFDLNGILRLESFNLEQEINATKLHNGLYHVYLVYKNETIGVEKLIIHD